MKYTLNLMFLFFLVSCSSQKSSSLAKPRKATHTISYEAGGKIKLNHLEPKVEEDDTFFTESSKVAETNLKISTRKKAKPSRSLTASASSTRYESFVNNSVLRFPKSKTSKELIIAKKEEKPEKDPLSNQALTFSIIALIIGWFPIFGLIFIIFALVKSVKAKKKGTNKKRAKTAFILSLVSIPLAIVLTILIISVQGFL